MKAIYGLYPNPDSAQRAFDLLRDTKAGLGFQEADILVLSSEPFDHYEFGRGRQKTPMPWVAALLGVLGGLGGYWLLAYTQNAYPLATGGMRIVPMWTDGIIIYECAMFAAILGTFGTLLLAARLPSWKTSLYDPAISAGHIMIGVVNPPEDSRTELAARLREAGADQVKESSFA